MYQFWHTLSDHRDTPIRRISALYCPLLVSTIVLTLCDICMPEAFCSLETVRKKILLNLWVLWEKTSPASFTIVLFLTENTEEQNTQHSTETLSQPISQNLTATFSWNALWILYAGGVLWVRNCAQKCSVKSVSSVREKTHQRVVCVLSHRERAFYFSQKNTAQDDVRTAHM